MSAETVVLYPDYQGKATQGSEFVERLREAVPDALLVPILNGPADLEEIARKATGFDPVIAGEAKGLASTLIAGYSSALDRYVGAAVVRLDTAEHAPQAIPSLVEETKQINGMVI